MISIVIPVYNEARILREAVVELCRKLDELGWQYELILAENGSQDGTLKILGELAAQVRGVRWLHEDEPNYGRALKRGILEARGKVVIASDSAHYYENLDSRRPFTIAFHVGKMHDAFDTLLAQAPRSHIVPGHDPAVMTRFPKVADGVVRID